MIAEEMWWQETREVDEQTFATISELAAEAFALSGDVASRFLNRVPSYALITRFENPLRIGFRHEFYFAFFLATRIAAYLRSPQGLTAFLTRAVLTTVVAEEVAQTLAGEPLVSAKKLLSDLRLDLTGTTASDVARGNLGVLYWAAIHELGTALSGAQLREGTFNGLDFSRTKVHKITFENCSFNQCVLVGAAWNDVSCRNCSFVGCVVTQDTKLAISGLALRGGVMGIVFQLPSGESRQFYALTDVGTVMERLGVKFNERVPKQKELSPRSQTLIEQLQRFLRIPERSLYFSDEDYKNRGMRLDGEFRELMTLLRKHGLLLDATQKHRRGLRKMFRLSETPEAIRQGQAGSSSSASIRGFWTDVLSS